MNKKLLLLIITTIIISNAANAKKCTGQFVNPITDINWSCMFPITIGSIEIVGSELTDTKNPSSPICICPKFGIPMPGIVGGYWEPARLVDESAEPYCFVNLGGLEWVLREAKEADQKQRALKYPDGTLIIISILFYLCLRYLLILSVCKKLILILYGLLSLILQVWMMI